MHCQGGDKAMTARVPGLRSAWQFAAALMWTIIAVLSAVFAVGYPALALAIGPSWLAFAALPAIVAATAGVLIPLLLVRSIWVGGQRSAVGSATYGWLLGALTLAGGFPEIGVALVAAGCVSGVAAWELR
jgi:hypothetical protein